MLKDGLDQLVEIRPYRSGDFEFVVATWIRGAYYGNTWFKEIPKAVFMERYRMVLSKILSQPQTTIWVASLKEEPDVIVGYTVLGSPDMLHFVYVKEAWRKLGVATFLVKPHKPKICSHLTKIGLRLKPKEMIFNPFL